MGRLSLITKITQVVKLVLNWNSFNSPSLSFIPLCFFFTQLTIIQNIILPVISKLMLIPQTPNRASVFQLQSFFSAGKTPEVEKTIFILVKEVV